MITVNKSMQLSSVWKKERKIWHDHFIPGIMAGLLVGIIAFFFQSTGSNIALFASIGASAVILTHKYRHHLTLLRTIIGSYVIAGLVGVALLNVPMSGVTRVVLSIFLVTMALYSVNIFHPPAISAGLAIVLYDRHFPSLVYLLLVTLAAFIAIRLLLYVFYDHLSPSEFMEEFIPGRM